MAPVRLRLGFGVVFLLAGGCASDRDAIDRRLAGLSDDITRLQAANDRLLQRVDALEVERTVKRRQQSQPKAAAPAVEHTPLKVVKLEPEGSVAGLSTTSPDVSPAERPDAPGERPVIRVRGNSGPKGDSRSDGSPSASVRVVDEEAK